MKRTKYLLLFASAALLLGLAGCAGGGQGPASTPQAGAPPDTPADAQELQALASQPDDEPGAILARYVSGAATFLRGGEEQPLAAGTLLREGDAVKTGEDGMAVLQLDDEKQVQVAAGSHVEIAGFERGAGGDKTLLLLHQGNIISILDSPLGDDDSYQVETPTLVMAIRGTIASVASNPAAGRDHVLLFEGRSVVRSKASEDVVEVSAGEYARAVDDRLERGGFTGADLNRNEYWFLYEAAHPAFFNEGSAPIAGRLQPLLDGAAYADDYTGKAGAPSAEDNGAGAEGTQPAGGGTPAPAGSPPAAPPASDPPATGGMDAAAFAAIEQAFLQAKQAYNDGQMDKDTFLAAKQRYVEAKQQYYGG